EARALPDGHAGVSADPDAAVAVLGKRLDGVARQPLPAGEDGRGAARPAGDSFAAGGGPQAPGAVFARGGEGAPGAPPGLAGRQVTRAEPVEAPQSLMGAEPEIAVARPLDGLDHVLVGGLPDVLDVLGEGAPGRQRAGRAGSQ